MFRQITSNWIGNTLDLNIMETRSDRIVDTPHTSYSMGTTLEESYWVANRSGWAENKLETDRTMNFTVLNVTLSLDDKEELGFIVSNIQLLNAIVLAVAVTLMILFICTFVLKVFSRYHDDENLKEDGETMYYV